MDGVDQEINRPFSFHSGDIEEFVPSAIAEVNAKACENSAGRASKRDRRSGLTTVQQKRAATWRSLSTLPKEEADQVCDGLFLTGCDTIAALFVCADQSDAPLALSGLLVNQILNGLLRLAASGRKGAAEAFINSVGLAVNNFEFLATRNPTIFPTRHDETSPSLDSFCAIER